MENATCDLCGPAPNRPFLLKVDRFSGKSFQYVSCAQCGLVFLNPRPEAGEIGEYYPESYEAYRAAGRSGDPQDNRDVRQALRRQLDYIEGYTHSPGHLLDVGCAIGIFLEAARRRGWEVMGVELIDAAASIARQQQGLKVATGTIESASLPEGHFDIITLWDVLEHLPSPKIALQRCYKLLKPAGWLAFSIPNLNGFDRYLFGQSWIGWDPPRHFYLYTMPAIQRLFLETGFRLIDQRCLFGGKGTFFLTLNVILGIRKWAGLVRRVYPLISAMLWPYRQLSYLMHKGPIITGIVQKIN